MPGSDPRAARRLAGRDEELRRLESAVGTAAAGKAQVVMVEADAGMGKSALLDALTERLDGSAARVGVSRLLCDVYEQTVPFGLAEIALGSSVAADSDSLSVGRRLLEWLTEAQRSDATVVLVVDDVQWMDRESVDALRFALRRLRADRVVAVLARRPPADDDPWAGLLALDRASTLRPGRLTAPEVVDLARRERGWAIPAATAELLVARTGGLPLLVQAFLADGHREMLDDPASLPGTVTESVHRLLMGLQPEARRLLQALAVLDEPSELVALGEVAGVPNAASALSDAGRTIALAWDVDRRVVRFSHELFRRAVYDTTPQAVRQDVHRRAVAWTTGERRLGHRVAAAAGVDAALAEDLVTAAEEARAQRRPGIAAGHLLQARSLTSDAARRDDLLLQAALLRLDVLDVKGTVALRPLLDTLPPTPFRSLVLGILARELGEVDDARRLLAEALEASRAAGDEQRSRRAVEELASSYVLRNEGAAALAILDQVGADPGGRTSPRLAMMRGIALWQEGRGAEGVVELSGPDPTVDLLSSSGLVRFYEGDMAGARRDLDEAIRLSRSGSSFEMLDRAYVQRCLVHYNVGEWDLAAVDAHSARILAEDAERPWTAASAFAISAIVPTSRGQLDLARQYLASARAAYERTPSVQSAALLLRAAALEASLSERWEQVVGMLESVHAAPTFERLLTIGSYRWLMVLLVRGHLQLGARDRAQAALSEYGSLLTRFGGHDPARVRLLEAEVALARGDDAAARDAYAAELADPALADFPYLRAETLHGAGRLERAVGNRRRALELLGEARAILSELRAAPLLARVDADLADAGVTASRGQALDLTPREQDVASLVARGHTNAEVAGELFLTAKTIEYHLGNIYAKLGISGRRQLRERMRAQDAGVRV